MSGRFAHVMLIEKMSKCNPTYGWCLKTWNWIGRLPCQVSRRSALSEISFQIPLLIWAPLIGHHETPHETWYRTSNADYKHNRAMYIWTFQLFHIQIWVFSFLLVIKNSSYYCIIALSIHPESDTSGIICRWGDDSSPDVGRTNRSKRAFLHIDAVNSYWHEDPCVADPLEIGVCGWLLYSNSHDQSGCKRPWNRHLIPHVIVMFPYRVQWSSQKMLNPAIFAICLFFTGTTILTYCFGNWISNLTWRTDFFSCAECFSAIME